MNLIGGSEWDKSGGWQHGDRATACQCACCGRCLPNKRQRTSLARSAPSSIPCPSAPTLLPPFYLFQPHSACFSTGSSLFKLIGRRRAAPAPPARLLRADLCYYAQLLLLLQVWVYPTSITLTKVRPWGVRMLGLGPWRCVQPTSTHLCIPSPLRSLASALFLTYAMSCTAHPHGPGTAAAVNRPPGALPARRCALRSTWGRCCGASWPSVTPWCSTPWTRQACGLS